LDDIPSREMSHLPNSVLCALMPTSDPCTEFSREKRIDRIHAQLVQCAVCDDAKRSSATTSLGKYRFFQKFFGALIGITDLRLVISDCDMQLGGMDVNGGGGSVQRHV